MDLFKAMPQVSDGRQKLILQKILALHLVSSLHPNSVLLVSLLRLNVLIKKKKKDIYSMTGYCREGEGAHAPVSYIWKSNKDSNQIFIEI